MPFRILQRGNTPQRVDPEVQMASLAQVKSHTLIG
jgi:hypothetical protein